MFFKSHDWLKPNGTWSSHLTSKQKELINSPIGEAGLTLFKVWHYSNNETAELIRMSINDALQLVRERENYTNRKKSCSLSC